MPIIEAVDARSPLTQGDVLAKVSLRATGPPWDADSSSTETLPNSLCLVISRPCVAQHESAVVAAAIDHYTHEKPSAFEDFDEAIHFYRNLRDGLASPDLFYIGQLDGHAGSLCARLDSLHTVKVPKAKTQREQFIVDKRVGRLSPDFARDLHLRLFRSYASLGFDDHVWFTTDDLKAVVQFGERDLTSIKAEIRTHEARIQSLASQGEGHESDISGLKKQLAKLTDKHSKISKQLDPYWTELLNRTPPTAAHMQEN